MELTKQNLKTIVESKTGQKFDEWKDKQLEHFMLMLMKKGSKEYKQWEDQFVEFKVLELLIDDAKDPIKSKRVNEGGNV